jgi:hypothetical protein
VNLFAPGEDGRHRLIMTRTVMDAEELCHCQFTLVSGIKILLHNNQDEVEAWKVEGLIP